MSESVDVAASDADTFGKLFWAARKEHIGLKAAATPDSPAHRAAVDFADSHGWPWAKELLEASRLDAGGNPDAALALLSAAGPSVPARWHGLLHFLVGSSRYEKKEYTEAIKAYRKALNDPKFEPPGIAWNNLGNALADKGEHDDAIKAYRQALDDPKYETPGNAWYNLGNALADKEKHDDAIKAYRQALDDPNFETRGDAWNNLGNTLADKGEHDEAIKAYRKAIDDPKYETPGNAWNNLGTVLAAKGEHGEAIKAYRKAIDNPKYGTPAKAWINLGIAFADSGKIKEARKAFEASLKAADPSGSDHRHARFRLDLLKADIKSKALSPDDRALLDKPASAGATEQIEDKIIAKILEAGDTQYDKYIKDRKDSDRDDTLSILRGWSSAVTLLEGSERLWRGGGYFLKWRGHGVVIDPGFDFLRNFHDAGYHGREIGAVLVSHNHPDHNSDLKDIDDLRYEMWKRLKATGGPGSRPYVLVWDEDSQHATKFGSEKPKHQRPPIVMSSGFPQPFDLRKHASKIPIRVIPFKADHGSDVNHAMGMVIELLDKSRTAALRIGYTADTAYFVNLHKHLLNCDVLIAHISQPSIEELQDPKKLKSVHLGYRGTAKLLGECKPKLALIGEFWAGLTDLRIPLVKGLQQRSGVKHVLPTGLGMHLALPSLAIECTECHAPTAFADVKVAPPADQFGNLAYLCKQCMLG